jgi:hypothetical protein
MMIHSGFCNGANMPILIDRLRQSFACKRKQVS